MDTVYQSGLDRGVVTPDHPPVIQVVKMAISTKNLKAGTVLKSATGGYTVAAAADTPSAVLVEDVGAHTAVCNAKVIKHGVVVRSRLLDFSDTAEAAATDTLANKLPTAGIYLNQPVWTDTDFV